MKTIDLKKLATALRVRRTKLDITQREVAVKLGTSLATVSRLENGRGAPKIELLLVACEWAGIDPRELLTMGPASFREATGILSKTERGGSVALTRSAAPEGRDGSFKGKDIMKPEEFDCPCIVELLGHQRIGGRVRPSDQPFADLRLDTYAEPPSTHYYSRSSIYGVHPTTAEIARDLGGPAPVHPYQIEPRAASFDDGRERHISSHGHVAVATDSGKWEAWSSGDDGTLSKLDVEFDTWESALREAEYECPF